MRRPYFLGRVGGYFPDMPLPEEKRAKGAGARVPDRSRPPTRPHHQANQSLVTDYGARLGGNWIYAD